VGQMPGALPLLSFTLSELYVSLYRRWQVDRSTDRTLRFADYKTLGGVAGALTRRATEEYDRLIQAKDLEDGGRGGFGVDEGKAYQATMQRVMLRMVVIEGGGVARQRVPNSELVYSDARENERVIEVIKRLVEARLLVTGQESRSKAGKEIVGGYVEPAHDFLVNGWDLLKQWLEKEQENLILQQRLTPQVNDWHKETNVTGNGDKSKQAVSFLWNRDPRLSQLKNIQRSKNNWFNAKEARFVSLSIEKRKVDGQRLVISLAGVILALMGLTTFAFIRQQEAEKQTALSLTSSSEADLRSNQDLDALISSIKAGNILKNRVIPISGSIRLKVILALHNAVYNTRETNRFEGSRGHRSNILSIRFSHDGRLIASGDSGDFIKLWNADGSINKTISFPTQQILDLSFSPTNREIAAIDRGNNVIFWSTLDGEKLKNSYSPTYSLPQLNFNSNLINGTSADRIWNKLWENSNKDLFESVTLSRIFNKNRKKTVGFDLVRLSPDGKFFVVSVGNVIEIWNIEGSYIRTIGSHKNDILDISFSPDNKLIASASRDNTIKIWSRETFSLLETIDKDSRGQSGHSAAVMAVNFSRDYKLLISLDDAGIGKIWDTRNFTLKETFKWDSKGVSTFSISFSPDGKTFAVGYDSGKVRIWDIDRTSLEVYAYKDDCETFDESIVNISPDGKTIISTGCKDIRIWNPDGKLKNFISYQDSLRNPLITFSRDGQSFLVSLSSSDKLKLYRSDGNLIRDFNIIGLGALSPNGNSVAFVKEEKIQLYSIDERILKSLEIVKESSKKCLESPRDIKFSDDGKIILVVGHSTICSVSVNGEFSRVFDLQNSKGRAAIKKASLSRNGKMLAIASFDNTIALYDSKTGSLLQTLIGHTGPVDSIVFSPDGSIIVSASSRDETIRFWDSNGTLLNLIDTKLFSFLNSNLLNSGSLSDVDFSPDGQILFSVSGNNLTLWNLNLDKLLTLGCKKVSSYLNNPNTNLSQEDRHLCQGI